MKAAQKPADELERMSALRSYNILDSLPEKEYEDIVQIASVICNMPISLISLIDTDRQWFKSRLGLDAPETSRDLSFCAHAILTPEEIFIVDNPSHDDRFYDNPLVTGNPNIAFYAGVPLVDDTGSALGTLCVLDSKPNSLSKEQQITLKALARQVVAQLEVRKKNIGLHAQKTQLEQLNKDLSRFAYAVAHDIKSPLGSLSMGVAYLKNAYLNVMDKQGIFFLDQMESTSLTAISMVNGILEHTQIVNRANIAKEKFNFGDLFSDVKKLISLPPSFIFEANNTDLQLFTSRPILLQILLNLCNNAIKYNDKEQGLVIISASENDNVYSFSVKDNGPGIPLEYHSSIFELFSTLGTRDRYNNGGTGIGLSTVKQLVEKMGGAIEVNSEPGMGCSFDFTLFK